MSKQRAVMIVWKYRSCVREYQKVLELHVVLESKFMLNLAKVQEF